MWRFFLLCLILVLSPLSLYAQDYKVLESATISVAEIVGKSVVSITAVIKDKPSGGFYYGAPYGGSEEDLFRRFFEDFFGEIPQERGRMALGSGCDYRRKRIYNYKCPCGNWCR